MATRGRKRKMETKHLAEPTPKIPSMSTIMQLGNECLQKVLSYLNVRELMKIELVCKDFKDVAEEIYKEKRSLDFDRLINWAAASEEEDEDEESERKRYAMSMEEGVNIFRRVGAYVEKLKMKSERFFGIGNPLDFVWKYCQKLEKISLDGFKFDNKMCTKLAGVFSNVKDVNLGCIVTDENLQTMFNLQQVKKIMLSYAKVKGDFLTHLRDINEIILLSCKSLNAVKFRNFIEANPQLISLDIKGCDQLDGTCLKAIGRKLVNLENLGISTEYEDAELNSYLPMMDLPKLTTLMINVSHCPEDPDEGEDLNMGALLAKVASHNRLKNLALIFNHYIVTSSMAQAINKLTKLEELSFVDTPMCIWHTLYDIKCAKTLEVLDVSQTKLSADGLTSVIKKCKKIKFIDASCCHRLEADFVQAIKRVLRARRHQLVIDLRSSTVCEDEVGSYDHNKLKLIF